MLDAKSKRTLVEQTRAARSQRKIELEHGGSASERNSSEEARRESGQMYRDLWDNVSDLIAVDIASRFQ